MSEQNISENNNLALFKRFADGISKHNKKEDIEELGPNKLASSNHREEAERKYELSNHNISAVHRWLVEQGEDLSYSSVHYYFNKIYKSKKEDASVAHLAEKLIKWEGLAETDEDLLKRYIKMLDMELTTLIADNSNVSMSERRKNTELALKISQTINGCREQLIALEGNKSAAIALWNTYHNIVQKKLQEGVSPETRQVLKSITEELAHKHSELM